MKVMMFGVFFHFSGPVHARLMSSSLSIFLKNERSTRAICRCSEEEEENTIWDQAAAPNWEPPEKGLTANFLGDRSIISKRTGS